MVQVAIWKRDGVIRRWYVDRVATRSWPDEEAISFTAARPLGEGWLLRQESTMTDRCVELPARRPSWGLPAKMRASAAVRGQP